MEIKDVSPLQPIKITIENESGDILTNIFYHDPETDYVYNSDCSLDKEFNEVFASWAEKKKEEIQRRIMSEMALARVSPEQFKAMGFDNPTTSPGGIILGK